MASLMDRSYDVPSRAEMEPGSRSSLNAQAPRSVPMSLEATRVDGDVFVLETSDGDIVSSVVFAIGVTAPWTAPIPGLEHAAHYVDVKRQRVRQAECVHRRQAPPRFEIAAPLPWAKRIVLASPRAIRTRRARTLAASHDSATRRACARQLPASIVDASIERVSAWPMASACSRNLVGRPARLRLR